MKAYKIQVIVTKTAVVTEPKWREEGGIGEFGEFEASQYVKGMLIEDLTNDPNRGTVRILASVDTGE